MGVWHRELRLTVEAMAFTKERSALGLLPFMHHRLDPCCLFPHYVHGFIVMVGGI